MDKWMALVASSILDEIGWHNGVPPDVSSLRVTREILGLIAEIDEFKGAWLAVGRLAPDRLSRLQHVATIESIGSSTRIEGATLSDREVERLLAAVEVGSFATRDEQEVAGYADTMKRSSRPGKSSTSPRTTSASFTVTC